MYSTPQTIEVHFQNFLGLDLSLNWETTISFYVLVVYRKNEVKN